MSHVKKSRLYLLSDQITAASHMAHIPLEPSLSQDFLKNVAEHTKDAIQGLFPILEALSFQQRLVGYIPLLSQRSQLNINCGTEYENGKPVRSREIVVDLTKEETPDPLDMQSIAKMDPLREANPEGRGVKRSAEDSPVQHIQGGYEDRKLPFKKRRRAHISTEGGHYNACKFYCMYARARSCNQKCHEKPWGTI